MKRIFLLSFFLIGAFLCGAVEKQIPAIYFSGEEFNIIAARKGHIQGMAISPDAVYLGYDHGVFKFDRKGKFIKFTSGPNHTGDVCYHNGYIYSAVVYFDELRKGRGCVMQYDENLRLIRTYELDIPLDGITCHGGYLYFGRVGSPKFHRGNEVYRIAADFSGKPEKFDTDHGYETISGAQNICTDGKLIYMSYYVKRTTPAVGIFTSDMKLVGTVDFPARTGFETVVFPEAPGKVYFARLVSLYDRKKSEKPAFRIDFYRFVDGKMVNVTKM